MRAAKLAAMGPGAAAGSPPRTPAPGGFGGYGASSSSLSSSPALGGAAADADGAGPMDWGEPLCQERLLQCITTVRVQVRSHRAAGWDAICSHISTCKTFHHLHAAR